MKVTTFVSACLALALAEPPVPSKQYLPTSIPSAPSQHSSPSLLTSYGTPAIDVSNIQGGSVKLDSQFDLSSFSLGTDFSASPINSQYAVTKPKSQYGTPKISTSSFVPWVDAPTSQYGAPQPSLEYGAPKPNTQYGVPQISTNNVGPWISAPTSQYGPPQPNLKYTALKPNTQYGVPQISTHSTLSTPSSQYGVPQPSSKYGLPKPNTQYGESLISTGFFTPFALSAPNSQYGVPQLSSQYGLPSIKSSGFSGDDGNDVRSEPANYDFKYDVQDAEHGNDFGHAEGRQGNFANGRYHVLLPDGKRQTVEYTADGEGYKPKISYERIGIDGDNAAGFDGYGQGGSVKVDIGSQKGYRY